MVDLSAMEVVAEVALGLAGFSGVLIVLSRTSDGLGSAERFRLRSLIYASVGTMFLALLPLALFGGRWAEATVWQILGGVMTAYTAAGLMLLPPASFRLRHDFPDLFPLPLIFSQMAIHICSLLLAMSVLFRVTEHPLNAYVLGLILLLAHGAIAFVRTLFYRPRQG
jgi:hypothetical protein